MPLPFDATVKDLVRDYPHDWLTQLVGPVPGPVGLETPDLSTVSAFSDLVLRTRRHVYHLDFQTGPDARLPRRLLAYNALLYNLYGLPVHTVAVLLRRRANHRNVTGRVEYAVPPGRGAMAFRYEVVRLWERPADELLAGPVGALPLAVLGRLPAGVRSAEGLVPVVTRLTDRLTQEVPQPVAARLLTASFVLSGLRVNKGTRLDIFRRVRAMRESSTYQYILEEGALEYGGRLLLDLGEMKFGTADEATQAAVQAVKSPARLERMTKRLLTARSWDEVLRTR